MRLPTLTGSLLAAILAGCENSSATVVDAGTDAGYGSVIDAGRYTLTVLAPASSAACDPHAGAAALHFSNVTADWGIAADGGLPLEATTLVAADLDMDGYPDLIALNGFNAFPNGRETIPTVVDGKFQNLPDAGLSFSVAVLMNRPKPDGGRFFQDATAESGLAQIRGGSTTQFRDISIATIGDLNNDGAPDVLTAIVQPPLDGGNTDVPEVMLNDGTGHFSFAPQSAPSQVAWDWFPQGLALTDVDNDGHLDAYEAFWFDNNHTFYGSQQQLYRGNGDGTFATITQDAGLERVNFDGTAGQLTNAAIDTFAKGQNSHPAIGVTVCDLNGDGYPELLASSYGQQWNTLYQNDGTGTFFTEVAQDAGYAGDNNRDWHDNQYFLCWCSDPSNKSNKECDGGAPLIQCPKPLSQDWEPPLQEIAANLNGNGFTTVCREMFGSGQNDLYVANIKHWWAGQAIDTSNLLVNETSAGGAVTFDRLDNAADGLVIPHDDPQGWNEGLLSAAAADLDNDGRPDLIVGATDYAYQRALLYLQQNDKTFKEQAVSLGVTFPCADGFAIADFDRDGALDLIIGASLERQCVNAPPEGGGYTTAVVQMFASNAAQSTHWLELRLRGDGVGTNSMGIGARVIVTVNGVPQMQEMQGTFGHVAIGDDVGMLFWGLGACDSVDSIEVRWPNKSLSVDTYKNVPADHVVELRQGDPSVYAVNLPH